MPFTLRSEDFTGGAALPTPMWGARLGGEDRSPHLSWSGFPEATASFALTCFDPDAPGGPGWWHWIVTDLPPDVTELPAGAGAPRNARLPDGATAWRNQSGIDGYSGPTPPAGTGLHHYEFTVYALDVPSLALSPDASFADLDAALARHELARATLTGTASAA
ncbi:YbhB/YbcL family Raf kinase inhibitor-like protein [Agromyces aerolatus]|uniref:YbhB/YbcL family Raf kinase inhibitor-like protein n=1 Tax=Agromyces sp. LY-1074 TaxID=3074080 RepID=UPI00285A512E|nr:MULTISPECIES: YbhB/YbcL family Raf kinase inhibitor-like protein [unclassified Agromyces]MDR5701530.1 YbhB/YbcL family Raf kinase inhibitor-like protein [Agromyces sp. LY-1074]MDR5707863.1 YbhB/YbcL family Raf kinase inhibitor-like protein [Agromyces sp. LY-1358]